MKRIFTLTILLGTLWFAGCKKSEPVDPAPTPVRNTFIMFGKVEGFPGNITDAQSAVAEDILGSDQRLLIYNDAEKELFELAYDKGRDGYRRISRRKYDSEVSCLDPERFRRILEDAKKTAPAAHYGLSVGTHGSGWLQVELGRNIPSQSRHLYAPLFEKKLNPATRHMNGELDVEDFAKVLQGLNFDFVILDECLMGGVEVAYELRNATPYLIISPAEVMMYGFPFKTVLKTIFSDWGDLRQVCRDYIDFYASSRDPYATISLIKTSELEPLAATVRAIVNSGVNEVGQAGLQYFYNGVNKKFFFDFGQYIEKLSKNDTQYQIFLYQLSRTVVHTGTTGRFYPGIAINEYSGLTTYVPEPDAFPLFYEYYQKTSWYEDVFGD